MPLIIAILAAMALCFGIILWTKRREQRVLERRSLTPQALYSALTAKQDVLVFDVRQPLDLLAYPEIIPGAKRIPPEEILARPELIPKEKDSVLYCTCPSDRTSRAVLRRALDMQLRRVKFLKGGLAAWKALGYPVEKYEQTFHLYSSPAAATK
jgi:rhodanese-related sulfurtransferase